MTVPDLRTNPNALPGAEAPRIGRYRVNGTTLYAEVRGSGPAVLLVHAGGEDAEQWRPVAECLSGFTVVTYDRRGTLRSGRESLAGRWLGTACGRRGRAHCARLPSAIPRGRPRPH